MFGPRLRRHFLGTIWGSDHAVADGTEYQHSMTFAQLNSRLNIECREQRRRVRRHLPMPDCACDWLSEQRSQSREN